MRYTLRDDGYSFKKIMTGRKWVGRVVAARDGFYGRIGSFEAYASTEAEAFRKVAALALGFASPEALAAKNAEVRHANSVKREKARNIARDMLGGNFRTFEKAIDELFRS